MEFTQGVSGRCPGMCNDEMTIDRLNGVQEHFWDTDTISREAAFISFGREAWLGAFSLLAPSCTLSHSYAHTVVAVVLHIV